MSYKRISPAPVSDGGTGAQTLTGILKGNGTSAITALTLTQHDVLVGGASNAITSVAPSATSGIPLVSNGASADPSFTTATVAGGGTGVTTMTTAYAPVCAGTTATGALQVASTGLGTAGWVLTSNGSSALPSFQAVSGGITTINGNSGSVTGSTVTLTGGSSGAVFSGSSATMTMSFNNVSLPTTTSSVGQILMNTQFYLHSYGSFTNTFGGYQSGNTTLTNNLNTCFGYQNQRFLTSGTGNTSFGSGAMSGDSVGASISANFNTAVGSYALNAVGAAAQNTAVGASALRAVGASSGGNNSALGYQALAQITTGAGNTCIGYNSGVNYTTSESNNILINDGGTVGESNVMRLSGVTKSFIAGIRGVTTTNNDAVAVLIDSAGQLGTVSSSIRYKENVSDMNDVSTPILSLRPVIFDFIGKPSHKKQVGLIAEEVEKIMPSLIAYNEDGEVESVKYHDLPVLLLNEIQKLRKELDDLKIQLNK